MFDQLLLRVFRKRDLVASRFYCLCYYDVDFGMVASVAGEGREVGGTPLRRSDAERQGALCAQNLHLHTGGAPEPNITHTIEHIQHEICEIPYKLKQN